MNIFKVLGIKALALFMVVIVLSGCVGGGGGSFPIAVKNLYITEEYNAQYGLSNIKAFEIYSDGYSGAGVIVAVIDTGVDVNHPDLIDNIAPGSYDFVDDDDDASPSGQGRHMSHGTHVAGIIAGMKNDVGMHGVAYNAKILALRAGGSVTGIFMRSIEKSIDHAISQGAKVINASFSSPNLITSTRNKWLAAHNNDIVSVHSAGNSYQRDTAYDDNNPLYGARLPIEEGYEALASTLIAVVATDSSNTIAKYSNRCGDAMQWCMAAPGSGIYSTVATTDDGYANNYAFSGGTSMAAPHVSGAVAVLRSKWPSKTAAEVVTILYDTATDLGVAGTDIIYGRGLLNLDNAVYAQGALTVRTMSGDSYHLSDSSFSSSSILGNALNQSLGTAVYDKYKRDYYFDLNNAISIPKQIKISDELIFSDTNFDINLEAGVTLSGEINKGSVQIQNNYQDMSVSFSHQQNPARIFAFNEVTQVAGLSDVYSLYGDSHLSKVNHANAVNIASNGNFKTSFGIVSGYTDASNVHGISGINVSVFASPVKDLSLMAQISFLKEDETFLSSYFSGAYQTGVAKTKAINLIVTSKINKHFSLITQLSKGTTQVATLKDSVVSNFSNINSLGYSLSLLGNDVYSQGDQLFATFKQPMKVISGNMVLTTANGLNLDDSISFTDQTVNLNSIGVERVLTLGYVSEFDNHVSMVVLLNHRNNPNHDASLKSESQIMIKISKKF